MPTPRLSTIAQRLRQLSHHRLNLVLSDHVRGAATLRTPSPDRTPSADDRDPVRFHRDFRPLAKAHSASSGFAQPPNRDKLLATSGAALEPDSRTGSILRKAPFKSL
jgi:hypothetical protein